MIIRQTTNACGTTQGRKINLRRRRRNIKFHREAKLFGVRNISFNPKIEYLLSKPEGIQINSPLCEAHAKYNALLDAWNMVSPYISRWNEQMNTSLYTTLEANAVLGWGFSKLLRFVDGCLEYFFADTYKYKKELVMDWMKSNFNLLSIMYGLSVFSLTVKYKLFTRLISFSAGTFLGMIDINYNSILDWLKNSVKGNDSDEPTDFTENPQAECSSMDQTEISIQCSTFGYFHFQECQFCDKPAIIAFIHGNTAHTCVCEEHYDGSNTKCVCGEEITGFPFQVVEQMGDTNSDCGLCFYLGKCHTSSENCSETANWLNSEGEASRCEKHHNEGKRELIRLSIPHT
jgi:hypothetical protein